MTRVALLVALSLFVVACSADQAAWPKTAGETSCAEWIDQMTIDQRTGLANAMLDSAWQKAGAAEHPGDAVTLRFANAIGGTCAAYRDEKVSAVAGTLYTLSNDVQPGN